MFSYSENDFYCEQVPLADLAHRVGTPAYVYSSETILTNFRAYDEAFGSLPHTVCYAVKANSSLAILALLSKAGAGFDIVSGGELFRVLQAGGDPAKVVFSGVGKTADEVEYALAHGIHTFNCESEAELALIDAKASRLGVKAGFAIRVNPDVDASTHPYISTGLHQHKFGIAIQDAPAVYQRAQRFRNLTAEGVSCHIGSQILDPSPIFEAVDKALSLADQLRAEGSPIRHLDLGGGLGVKYSQAETAPEIAPFVAKMKARLCASGLSVMVEPGRSIVGPAGVLLTRVLYRKHNGNKEFVIVDAAMNDLIRPALYHAHHDIVPLRVSGLPRIKADVVGPVCESGDFLARDREMDNAMPGDYLAVCTAGAYGFVQASNYNSRPRVPEVLVEGASYRVIRARETYADLVRGETLVIEPARYTCYRAAGPIVVDGKLDELSWQLAPKSTPFVDIVTGEPAWFDTRVALLWDDDYLYFGFWIEENDVWGTLAERDSKIYEENDVEVFIGGRDTYYEFEINALNTVYEVFWIWKDVHNPGFPLYGRPEFDPATQRTLVLDGVGGHHHPRGERWGFLDWDFPGLKTAVHVDGAVNSRTKTDRGWTVELAFPWKGLAEIAEGRTLPPRDGDTWRIDCSRFEKIGRNGEPLDPCVGWTWNWHGHYDSHIPEVFPYVTFSREAVNSTLSEK